MSFNNLITEKIILPLSDLAFHQTITKHFNFLQKSQWWSIEELKEYQNKKLRILIKHAYENVPYYNDIFKKMKLVPADIKTTDDLLKIPILTKEMIRKNFPHRIVAKNIAKKKIMLKASSGSTGEPLQYYITKDAYSFNIASNLRGWYWMGYRIGDKYVKLSQNPREELKKKLQDKINRCNYISSQQLTEKNIKKTIKEIKKYNPAFIRGYPDPMYLLAKYIKNNSLKIPMSKAINTTGNILFNQTRKLIEEQFHCKVFDSYSCEGGANIFECETHEFYHSSMEYAITEILDTSREVPPGERGRLVTTDLRNFAVPFIRYDSQDIVKKGENHCICGRGLFTIKRIEGRDNDFLITPSGKYLIVHNFTGYFEWINTVKQFQVIQEEINKIIIKLVVNETFNEYEKEKIHKYWSTYVGEDIKIYIELVDNIPLTTSGKRRFLIRNKHIPLDL